VYTSADSVLQIAAHEDVVPLDALYALCRVGFDLVQRHNVVRVIARPFVGTVGAFVRTPNRKDFAQEPGGPTLMDHMRARGLACAGVGKIPSIYGHRGFSREVSAGHNPDILEKTLRTLDEQPDGLVFSNLVDLDAMYGHRRDPRGYAAALKTIDDAVPALVERMRDDDLLVFTADHGCDPTYRGSDHTREYVPLVVYRRGGNASDLGTRRSLADLGRTLCDWFGVPPVPFGTSFADAL
jgi:phosphopentomutase